MTQIQVQKRDGRKEPLDLEKLHRVVFWATEGITGVSASEVEIRSHLQFTNGIATSTIQETLIKSAADLISEDTPNYQYVAGRLVCYHLRKQVYGQFTPCTLLELVERNVKSGFYDPQLLEMYTADEWEALNSYIKHDRDELLTYVAMEQFRSKYLVQNRVTKEVFETPQMAYILIAAVLFGSYPKEKRLQWVKEYYDAISTHQISLPTPVMAGVRTPQRQFSSCVLIETGDSLDSINATSSAIVRYVSQKAGIGIGAGNIRAIGSPIRNGDAYHTGVIPFYKLFQAATRSCCVTPDTWVEVLDDEYQSGSKTKKIQIKDLKVGMQIKTKTECGDVVFAGVTNKWDTVVKQEDQVRLEFTNGVVLNCSVNHPIMVQVDSGEFAQRLPADLLATDQVLTDTGVTSLLVADFGQSNDEGYIDITVEDTHTFFASASEHGPMVLTHNSQGGVRNGAATLFYPVWHLEVEDLLVLKNNKGTEDNRVRHLDYGVQFNKVMYERLLSNGDITLFSPSDVPGLYDAFYADTERFRELYERAERNTRLRKKTVKAVDLFSAVMQERKDTGRIYIQNVDHANSHGSFVPEVAPIKQSNLCLTGDTKVDVVFKGIETSVTLEEIGALLLQDENLTVKSYNVESGAVEYKKVEAFAKTSPAAEIIEIFDDSTGKTIKCTADHKVFTKNRGYVRADELVETDQLLVI